MTPTSWLHRSAIPDASLALAMVLVVALAVWVALAENAHRRSATVVLKDYAALAGDELVRRITVDLGYAGYFEALGALRERIMAGDDATRAMAALAADPLPRRRAAASLVGQVFIARTQTIDLSVGLLETQELRGTLAAHPLGTATSGGPYRVLRVTGGDGGATNIVYASGTGGETIGFVVAPGALAQWLAAAVARAPLLPPSLGSRLGPQQRLFVSIRDPNGEIVQQSGAQPVPGLRAERPFGADYGGVLDGYIAVTGIPAAVMPALVAGGLPPSRRPLLLAMVLLVIALVGVAAKTWRLRQRLAAQRTDFVARVSHELRTPLTQISLYAETLLLDRLRDAGDRRHALIVIVREAQRLAQLVDNILKFASSGKAVVGSSNRQELATVIARAVETFAPLAQDVAVRVHIEDERLGAVTVPDDAMHRVLLNLLDNAIKHGAGPIEVVVQYGDNGAPLLAVEDRGSGIPTAQREWVFEPYVRNGFASGTGLGLAVVRELVQAMGGVCRIADRPVGTRMEIVLPWLASKTKS